MTQTTKTKNQLYSYLQKRFQGKLVAYSKKLKAVYATADNVKDLMSKLKKRGVSLKSKDLVLTGPIQTYGRTYVYFFPFSHQNHRGRRYP